ncbi:MAG TPA: hypothetical protein DCY89_05935 [Gammaproteobacteria bacterium]|nr:hypothetical protein [Gammaproteobacteria bacterium]
MQPTLIRGLASGLVLALFSGFAADVPATNRDATEIFFGPQTLLQGTSTPNILLALDTSGSMMIPLAGGSQTRFQALKDATRRLLIGMNNVNVGLMRFTCPGGPILYPVANIDAPSLDQQNQTVRVAASAPNDDAEEGTPPTAPTVTSNTTWFAGNAELHRRVLSLGNTTRIEQFAPQSDEEFAFGTGVVTSAGGVQWNINDAQRNGVRFAGLASRLTTAELARLASVTLRFTAASDQSGGSGVIHFQGERSAASPPFNGVAAFDPASRPLTDRLVPWSNPPAFANRQTYHSPELLPLFRDVMSTPGWNLASSPLTLYAFTSPASHVSAASGEAYSRGATVQRSPRRINSNPVQDQITLQVGVASSQNVGIRFPVVDIPKGAQIRAARVVFTAAPHPHTDGRRSTGLPDNLINPIALSTPVNVAIHGEKTGNACPFADTGSTPPSAADGCTPATTSPGRVSSRPLTSASIPAWDIPAVTPDLTYSTPDISNVVQELVNQDGYCGGNALSLQFRHVLGHGQRMVYSAEDGARSPRLEVEFDSSTLASVPDAGCMIRVVTARPAVMLDDAWSESARTNVSGSLVVSGPHTQWSGIRFQSVGIPRGARVIDAALTMRATGTNAGASALRIWGQNADTAPGFNSGSGAVSGRPRTSSNLTLTLNSDSSQYRITGLAPLVQQIVNRGGWQSGNALALLIQNDTRNPSNRIEVHSADTRVTEAPLLSVRLDLSQVASRRTNRDEMLAAVEALTAEGWTPLVGTQLEAARYLHGLDVRHGRGLGHTNPSLKSLSHPQSYAGGARIPANCGSGPGRTPCTAITGDAVYRSPITTECSPNHFVLLTDGEANHNHEENSTDHGRSLARDFVGANCQTTLNNPDGQGPGVTLTRNLGTNTNELCGRDIAHRLAHPPASSGDVVNPAHQRVVTHTVAFNLAAGIGHQFLQDVAVNGEGTYHSANTADELLAVFNDIVEGIDNQPTTFTAPATSVNTFNRLRNLEDVYFSMFEPSLTSAWRGNIKRYRVSGEDIVGIDGQRAVDQITGEFLDSARSFWDVDGQADGRKLAAGGAVEAQRALSPDLRRVFTYLGSYANVASSRAGVPVDLLPNSLGGLAPDQRARYAQLVGLAVTDPALPGLYDWVRGRDVSDEDSDGSTTDMRHTFGSPLHASPVVVTLGGTETAPVQMIIAASNDGALRWMDASTGRELGAFIPPEQLAIQAARRANTNGAHIYGLDATPSVWIVDTPPVGIIEPSRGDFVRVIFGERDGGDRYYAVELTPSIDFTPNSTSATLVSAEITPKFLWKIDGSPNPGDLAPGDTGMEFADLGLTWSEPVVRRVRFANEPNSRTVAIFGGGNDRRFDRAFIDLPSAESANAFDPKGNIIYIVDATTGQRLTAIGGPNTNADLRIPGMHHPIPSTIATMSSTGLREVDRLYFGDVGGKLWRVDLNPGITRDATGGNVATVGQLAAVAKPQTTAERAVNTEAGDSGAHGLDTRKFYSTPALVRQQDAVFSAAPRHTLVLLGTGSRANPLNMLTEDHFYAFRDLRERPFEPTASGVASGYPERQQIDPAVPSTATGPIGGTGGADWSGELVDVTSNPLQSVINGQTPTQDSPEAAALMELRESLGWFIRMPALQTVDGLSHDGEKVLNPAAVGLGTLLFTAFTPASFDSIAANCRAEVGITRIYGLNLSTGAANIGDFGDPPTPLGGMGSGPGDANVVLDGSDRSTRNPLRGNPGGTTLLNTDSLKSVTGTRVMDLGVAGPVPTYWFQRQ